jgi:hypothetical protein
VEQLNTIHMIKFFRHIRQQLLSEGKTEKYFKYAMGEIILVVIGILIALGINNWNENRKSKQAEKVVLNNIYKNLAIDSIQFGYYGNQFKDIDNLHLELYKVGLKNETIDSISEPLLIRRALYFKQLIGSDLKEYVHNIKNPNIREALISYTSTINDMELIYWNDLLPVINEKIKPYLANHELYNIQNWFELKEKSFKDYRYDDLKGKNLIDKSKLIALAKTKEFQQILFEVNGKWHEFYIRLEIVIKENSNLQKLIKSELKNY